MKPRAAPEQPPFGFLGEEFLLWLWHHCETAGGEIALADGAPVGIALDDFLCLGDANPEETEQTLRRGLPTRSGEATAALRAGKRVKRARLIVAEGDQEWSVVLDHELRFRSARCESSGDGEESDSGAARIAAFLRLAEIIDGLYQRFLAARLPATFASELAPRMREWIAAR